MDKMHVFNSIGLFRLAAVITKLITTVISYKMTLNIHRFLGFFQICRGRLWP